MGNIVILHFSPLELYPPIQNLLLQLDKVQRDVKVLVITTNCTGIDIPGFNIKSDRIRIVRYGKSGRMPSIFTRYWNYLKFHLEAIRDLKAIKPRRILYFETLSSFPAYVYHYLFRASVEVFIHYHEYTSPKEYQTVKLMGFFHYLEKKLLPIAVWVSHTNTNRMEQFRKDVYPVKIDNAYIVRNFPPMSWKRAPTKTHPPLKVVYIGALSLDTMYTEIFARWIERQQGMVYWDIYSYNYSHQVKDFLEKLNSPWIKLKPGVGYEELPYILQQYSVGVILYTGHIPNYIYNAPNKLFEYLACGLSVWFPSEMIGSYEYITKGTNPAVIKLDFANLNGSILEELTEQIKHTHSISQYYCDAELLPLINKLTADD